ncbi:MAG TPA: hypothetical protein V6C81_32210 [Planktothrix sp.]
MPEQTRTGDPLAPLIAIIAHEHDEFVERQFYLRELARAWQDNGLDVGMYIRPSTKARADIAILHVNLTLVPPEYAEFAQSFPITLNVRTTDISKRTISANILQRDSNYDGPVIVKGNENYGGTPEMRLEGLLEKAAVAALPHRSPQATHKRLSTYDYYVVDALDKVSEDVWANPYLVVEKFLPEREGDAYVMRTWHFLGDAGFHTKLYGHSPIIKSKACFKREPIPEPPPDELLEARQKLGFDYGKFDYAIHDGKFVLYDVNRTPTLGGIAPELIKDNLGILQRGIYKYLSQ